MDEDYLKGMITDVDLEESAKVAIEALKEKEQSESVAYLLRESKNDQRRIDTCDQCGGKMWVQGSTSRSSYICSDCGNKCEVFVDPDCKGGYSSYSMSAPSRLLVFGPGNGFFQRGLDSRSVGDYAEVQKKNIYEKFMSLNNSFVSSGGNAFSQDVLKRASELYHEVQKRYVKRDQKKAQIMAACLKSACLEKNFVRTDREIISFTRLKTRGIARGEEFLRTMESKGEIAIDMNMDSCSAHVNTVFVRIDASKFSSDLEGKKEAVAEIVRHAEDINVASSSLIGSKVIGSLYVVLVRSGIDVRFQELCDKCQIRTNTVKRFVGEITKYHSQFEKIYEKFQLDSRRPREISHFKIK